MCNLSCTYVMAWEMVMQMWREKRRVSRRLRLSTWAEGDSSWYFAKPKSRISFCMLFVNSLSWNYYINMCLISPRSSIIFTKSMGMVYLGILGGSIESSKIHYIYTYLSICISLHLLLSFNYTNSLNSSLFVYWLNFDLIVPLFSYKTIIINKCWGKVWKCLII